LKLRFLLLLFLAVGDVCAAEGVAIDLTKRTWQGIPGIERTAQGRVFVSWFTGGLKEPSPDNTVVLARSDDGKTLPARYHGFAAARQTPVNCNS